MFPLQLSFLLSLVNVFLVWLTSFSLNLLLPFRWPKLLLVYPYISCSTFVVSLYVNSYFSFFPASFCVTRPVRWYRHVYYSIYLIIIIIIIIIIITISFMQGIPETNYVPREYSVAAILLLLLMVLISLVSVLNLLYFYISTRGFQKVRFPIFLPPKYFT